MSAICKVVVDIALDREFDYRVPPALSGALRMGSRVTVPFGPRRVNGYVVGLADRSNEKKLKDVASIIGEKPFIDEKMLKLARWMSAYYCAPVEKAMRAVLPGVVRRRGKAFKRQVFVELSETVASRERGEEGRGKGQGGGGEKAGQERRFESPKLSMKQQAVVDLLRERGGMLLSVLIRELGITAAPVQALRKKELVSLEAAALFRNPLANRNILPTKPLDLMPEQAEALALIKAACEEGRGARRTVLLYGVTGSGKTEVYLQAIDSVLKNGKGAIVLVPEISLTPQTVERFYSRFGDRIAVLHSHLSDGERHDEWHRIRDGEAQIVIGARSAVFAPVSPLGLIVVDEEHEHSYKQEEAPPYSARDVAAMRGRIENCAVVLGSATPALESWHNARKGKYGLAVLPRRADNRKMPIMRVVDMRLEKERSGHAAVFSQILLQAIRFRLDRLEQTILFLNRRGFSTSLICPNCGYVATCDQCSVSYTYHRVDEALRCHICGGTRAVMPRCPSCQDPAFKFAGIGTQRVERVVSKCFPQARIQRMDADVTTRKDSYDRILGAFRSGDTDILIGTQMIAKGLHFPNVTLVGVVYADLSLHMPDFRAGERTFQLLAQVAGRAGRGDVSGEVIVQTYTPFNPAIQAARRLDYEGFCDQEFAFRRELKYPPFAHLVCVTLRGPSEEKVSFYASTLARKLKKKLSESVILSSPSPAPLARAKGLYRYQIMMRSVSPRSITEPLSDALRAFKLAPKMTLSIDVDALNLL